MLLEGEVAISIAKLSFDLALEIYNDSISLGVLDERAYMSYFRFTDTDKTDLSKTIGLFDKHIQSNVKNHTGYNRKLTLEFISYECLERKRKRSLSASQLDKVTIRHSYNIEMIGLLKQVKKYRNLHAHVKARIDDKGILVVLSGAVIRFSELYSGKNEILAKSLETAAEIANQLLLPLNHGLEQKLETTPESKITQQLEEMKSALNALTSVVSTPKGVVQSASPVAMPSDEVVASNVIPSDHDDTSDVNENFEITPYPKIIYITVGQAKNRLIELQKEIKNQTTGNSKPLSLTQNILQLPIVNDMLSHEVKNLEEWKNCPDIKWRYAKHKEIMDIQIDSWWEKIAPLLNSVIWREEIE